MCGINGFVGKKNNGIKVGIKAMAMKTQNRGPDYTGYFEDSFVSLAHNLLSTRNVSATNVEQPYIRPKSPWVLLFNGEIYGYTSRPLYDEAVKDGMVGDTGYLYRSIMKYGWDFVNHVDGMYIIALYNMEERILRIYRDPTGQKQLYYRHFGAFFKFSSQIDALLGESHSETFSSIGLDFALSIGHVPTRNTHIANIYKVLPGEMIILDVASLCLERSHFWSPNPNQLPVGDKAIEIGQANIRESVLDHCDTSHGILLNLSGGLDSSIIAIEMKNACIPFRAYTTSFKIAAGHSSHNQDAAGAVQLAKNLGFNLRNLEVRSIDYLNSLEEAYSTIEEPDYNVSLPTYSYLSRVQREECGDARVVLSGDGGDELFVGYSHYKRVKNIVNLSKVIGGKLANRVICSRYNLDPNQFDFYNPLDLWIFFKSLNFSRSMQNVNRLRDLLDQSLPSGWRRDLKNFGLLRAIILLDRYFRMPSETFLRTDKLYSRLGLEVRAPYASNALRNFFDVSLEPYQQIDQRLNKRWLRDAYHHRAIKVGTKMQTKKTGWATPLGYWYDNEFSRRFDSILSERRVPLIGIPEFGQALSCVRYSDKWGGKSVNLWLSIAVLSKSQNIT